MFRHRLAPEADYYRLPEPPAPSVQPTGFMLCTVAVVPGCRGIEAGGIGTIGKAGIAGLDATRGPCGGICG